MKLKLRGQIGLWSVFLFFYVCSPGFAAWELANSQPLLTNKDTTVTLSYRSTSTDGSVQTSGVLWLLPVHRADCLVPETVVYDNNTAAIPMFLRTSPVTLVAHDAARDETTTIVLSAKPDESAHGWNPHFSVSQFDTIPLVFANTEVTPTLSLTGGVGKIPPSAHISVTDHKNRLVFSRFSTTFDLLAGRATMRIPAAGYYKVHLRLLEDDVTSLPRTTQRDPEPVPYGTWVERTKPQNLEAANFLTTDVIVGSIVAFEHLPTTATVVTEDKLEVSAFARHSREIQKNRWPFVIENTDFESLAEHEQELKSTPAVGLHRMLGSSFASITVPWSALMKAPGSFAWYSIANLLPIYRQNLVRPLITLTGKAAWSDELPTQSSGTLNAWFSLSRELSERYKSLIWGLQCWEFPENSWPGDLASSYTELVDTTWKGFSTRDGAKIPAPPIVAGGTKEFNEKYLRKVLDAANKEAINGLSFHLFPKDSTASPEANGFDKTFAAARKLIRDTGMDDIQLWLLGTGWPNSPEGVTRRLQANYLVRAHALALAQDFYKITWSGLRDNSRTPWEGRSDQRSGLLQSDFSPKLAGVAYNVMTYMMSGVTARKTTRQGNASIFAYNIPVQSNKWSGILYVAWTEFPHETQDVLLNMTQGGGVYVLDYLGAEIPAVNVEPDPENPLTGKFRIQVGFEPVFIWDAGKPDNSSNPTTDVNQD